MRKYIIPTNGKIKKWNGFFIEECQTVHVQENLLNELISMATELQVFGRYNKQHVRLSYLLDCMSLVQDVDDRRMLVEDDLSYVAKTAADIGLHLVYFMRDISILTEVGSLRFESFSGSDIIVGVLNDDELFAEAEPWLDKKEREWRNAY